MEMSKWWAVHLDHRARGVNNHLHKMGTLPLTGDTEDDDPNTPDRVHSDTQGWKGTAVSD